MIYYFLPQFIYFRTQHCVHCFRTHCHRRTSHAGLVPPGHAAPDVADVVDHPPNPCLALPTCREQRVSGGVGQGRRQDVGHVVAVADLGPTQLPHCPHPGSGRVRKVFVHVGGTRDVPSRTDDILNIHARITLTVECRRGYMLVVLVVKLPVPTTF